MSTGEDSICQRSADGREAQGVVPALPRLRRLREFPIESDEQERQNNFGNLLFVCFLKKNEVNAIDLISAGGICDVCYTSQRRRSQAGFAGNNKCIEKHHLFIINGKRGHCFLVGTNRPTHAHTLGRVGGGGGKQSDAYIN